MSLETEHQLEWLKPSIHPSYARLLCAHVRNQGISMDDLFQGNSLDWDTLLGTQRFINFEQFRRLALNAIDLTDCPWLGLEISSIIQVSAHGSLGYGAVAANHVMEAFLLVEKALNTRITLFDFELHAQVDRALFIVNKRMELGEISEFIYVMLLGSFQDMLEKTSGSIAHDIYVSFPFEAPSWIDQYEKRFPGLGLSFSADTFTVDLPMDLLRRHCLTADEFAYRNALRECEQLMALLQSGGELSERIKHRLFEQSVPYPSQEMIAKDLGMSVRTLIRKLKSEQTSYQRLLDEVRKELACWHLQAGDMSIERIAESLGFLDTSNFSRVFRRWMGCTPSQFKKG